MFRRPTPNRVVPDVVAMCGLPASGKTTTAMRLHAALGGVLIRGCDVYAELGIVLRDWVERTHRFTVGVDAYDRVRDDAYRVIAGRLSDALALEGRPIVVDAVYGESPKRQELYAICRAHAASLALVLCRCDDPREIERRIEARRGRESEPEHEASDVSVYDDIRRRWRDPSDDVAALTIVEHDTACRRVRVRAGDPALVEGLLAALVDAG